MNYLDKYLPEYEAMALRRKKVYMKKRPIVLMTTGVLFIAVLLTYFLGRVVGLLQSIGYMFSASIIIVLLTYVAYRYFIEKIYLTETEETHSVWLPIVFESFYIFTILVSTVLFLLLSVYIRALSPVLGIVYGLLFITSMIIYVRYYKRVQELDITRPILLPITGFFIAILFYAVTLLVHINDFGLSLFLVLPTTFSLIQVKQYIVRRFYIRINTYAVVFGGIFLIILSFPFNRAFNYPSFYRGEFTFRVIYETLVNPVKEFEEDVNGKALFYDNNIVVVGAEEITFYNYDLEVIRTVDNLYETVYVMNDRLLANRIPGVPTPFIYLYEFDGTEFNYIGDYYVFDPSDKVFIEDDAYVALNGFVYEKPKDEDDYIQLEIEGTPTPTTVVEYDDFMIFRYTVPFMASTHSFRDEVQGYIFENLAMNNGHMGFVYTQVFVVRNSTKVNPEDDGKVLLYLTDINDYFADNSTPPPAFELPKLFRINEFYYIDNHYYLVGYIEYSTGNFNHKIIVLNDQGELEKELVFDGPNFAISDDYIMYGTEENIKLFSLDSETTMRYRLIVGYGVTFTTMALVAVFAIENINPTPRKKIVLYVKKENSDS